MVVLYGNDAFSILVLSAKKRSSSFLIKVCYTENFFQSYSIENFQNFPWLPHKKMPISQTEGYFGNPKYRF